MAKHGMSTDGDILFRTALLTCSRTEKPRDGGLAIGVLLDWLSEWLSQSPWVALCDLEGTGAVLIVMAAGERNIGVSVVDQLNQECDTTYYSTLGKESAEAVAKQLRWFWE